VGGISHAQVHDIELVETEISQIVVDPSDEFLARQSVNPGLARSPAGAQLGNNYQTVRIGMERPLDYLVGHVRTVEVAGIDVIHTSLNRRMQNSGGAFGIAGWSPYLRTCKLHSAIAHAVSQSAKCFRR